MTAVFYAFVWYLAKFSLIFFSLPKRNDIWYGFCAIVYLLQVLTCRAFRDALLYVAIEKNSYLCYYYLSNSMNQSDHNSSTRDFCPQNCHQLEFFHILLTILCKAQTSTILEYANPPIWHQQQCNVQSNFKSPFFVILMNEMKFSKLP